MMSAPPEGHLGGMTKQSNGAAKFIEGRNQITATRKEITTMKRTLIYLSIALLMIGAAVAASAAPTDKEVTLKGEVIDQPCYDKGGSKGAAHKACALSCAKRGNQLAIL